MNSVRLRDIARLDFGYAFDSMQFNTDGRGLPLVRIRDVLPGRSNTYYAGEYAERFIVDNGDYLIGMDGQFNLARWQGGKALLNQRVCRIGALDESLDRSYLVRFLPIALKAVEDATPFVTVKHLSAKALGAIQVPLPPLEEQRRIAALLDHADAARAKHRHALANLDALVHSIFVSVFGDPISAAPSRLRPLPDLLLRPVQNGAYFKKEQYADNGVEMVHMSDAFHGMVERGSLKRVLASTAAIDRYGVGPNDLLVARRSLNFEGSAKPCLVPPSSEPLLFESSLIRLTPDQRFLSVRYLFHYLGNSRVRRRWVLPRVTGATISGINQQALASIPVLVPTAAELQRFDSAMATVDKVRSEFALSLSLNDELFASLQSRAFGEEL